MERVARLVRRVGVRRHRDDPAHWLRAARAVMHSVPYCVLAVPDGPDEVHAATVEHRGPDRELRLHVGTSPTSRKARLAIEHGRATLAFTHHRDRSCVVAQCRVTALADPAELERWFHPGWLAFWPDGPHHDFVVLRCEPVALEVWDLRRGVTPPPFGLASARLVRGVDGWVAD
jgi:hypothetical protein